MSIQELKINEEDISNNDFPDALSFQCIIITLVIKRHYSIDPKKRADEGLGLRTTISNLRSYQARLPTKSKSSTNINGQG